MYSTDSMEYGSFPMDYPIPEDFLWVYPKRCGYRQALEAGTISGESAGLLVYLLSGTGTASLVGGEPVSYGPDNVLTACRAGDLLLSPTEPTEYLYLLLENGDELLSRLGAESCCSVPLADSRADRLMGRICYNARGKQPDNVYAASADAYTLLMELCAVCRPQSAQYGALVRGVIEIIRRDYAFLGGVEELADAVGVSKSHLIRVFTAETGRSPGKYLQTVKLDNAKLMLQNREYTIEMVADMAGYSGANYFCKVFRRATGESPGEYRERQGAPASLDYESRRRLNELEGIHHV